MHKLFSNTYVVLDIETTGLSPGEGGELIEIGAIKCLLGKEVEEFGSLIIPQRPVPEESYKIHGLSTEYLLQQGREGNRVITEFADFIGKIPLVGHNIKNFDLPFLNFYLKKLRLPTLSNEVLDTLEIAKMVLYLDNYKLKTIAGHFKIDYTKAHRAKDDARITHQVLLNMLNKP